MCSLGSLCPKRRITTPPMFKPVPYRIGVKTRYEKGILGEYLAIIHYFKVHT
jgi:hypothetical protein